MSLGLVRTEVPYKRLTKPGMRPDVAQENTVEMYRLFGLLYYTPSTTVSDFMRCEVLRMKEAMGIRVFVSLKSAKGRHVKFCKKELD